MNHAVSWPEAVEDIVFYLCLFSTLAFIAWEVMRDVYFRLIRQQYEEMLKEG